jgi:hypothetical protein
MFGDVIAAWKLFADRKVLKAPVKAQFAGMDDDGHRVYGIEVTNDGTVGFSVKQVTFTTALLGPRVSKPWRDEVVYSNLTSEKVFIEKHGDQHVFRHAFPTDVFWVVPDEAIVELQKGQPKRETVNLGNFGEIAFTILLGCIAGNVAKLSPHFPDERAKIVSYDGGKISIGVGRGLIECRLDEEHLFRAQWLRCDRPPSYQPGTFIHRLIEMIVADSNAFDAQAQHDGGLSLVWEPDTLELIRTTGAPFSGIDEGFLDRHGS